MTGLPDQLEALLDRPVHATLATLMADGSPHASTIWVDREGGYIRFNTAEGRVKTRNLDRDPRVAISIFDPDHPSKAFAVRGRVVEKRYAGADAHIDALARTYLGTEEYPFRVPGQVRVTYLIAAERVSAH